jgi:hypothetical protein
VQGRAGVLLIDPGVCGDETAGFRFRVVAALGDRGLASTWR